MDRRNVLKTILALVAPASLANAEARSPLPSSGPTDKDHLTDMFNRAQIDYEDPSTDHTPNAISIRVDGDTVVGIDGRFAVFVFNKGKLTKIILWEDHMMQGTE